MKILNKSKVNLDMPKYIIDVSVEFFENVYEVASSTFVKHPLNIKKKKRYTDGQLVAWNDFISSVVSIINGENFEIVRYQQSKRSYAFYLDFYPISDDGEYLDMVQIRFRIADHKEHGSMGTNLRLKTQIIKNFYVGSEEYASTYEVMQAVKKICKCLKKGDYTSLDKY